MAEPADASRELENGRFVRNRVVVVERGELKIDVEKCFEVYNCTLRMLLSL